MKKSLRNLAKVAAGLGAAYALTKMGRSSESINESDKGFGIDSSMDTSEKTSAESISPKKTIASKSINESDKGFGIDSSMDTSGKTSGKSNVASYNPKTGLYGEPGSLEGFRASEEARRERIGTPYALDPKSPKAMRLAKLQGAKTGKMIKASHGGSVIARGNKLARSKPTKLF